MKQIINDITGGVLLTAGIVTNTENAISIILGISGIVYVILRIRGQFLKNKISKQTLKKEK